MPKDKKKTGKKSEGTSTNTDKDDYKRRNSLTDASLTSSSTSVSSDTSIYSSIDSDESGSAAHSGSMTNGEKNKKKGKNGEGTSQSVAVEAALVDRTAELSIDPSGNAVKKNVLVVDEHNTVPISDSTHMKVINESSGESGDKSEGSSSPAKTSNSKVVVTTVQNKKKKNQKERKLTKKEKREKELSEGKAVGSEANDSKQKINRKQVEMLMKRPDQPHYQFQHFEDWPTDPTDHMLVKGMNPAAREALGADVVNMPFYGYTTTPKEPIVWLDGHRIGQRKYLKKCPVRGDYANSPKEEQLRQRMGFGVSATGFKNALTPTLSLNESKHYFHCTYDDAVAKAFHVKNWRNSFAANLMNEYYNRESRFKELQLHMQTHVFKMVEDEKNPFKKEVMQAVIDCDMEKLVCRIGEMIRNLKRNDVGMRKSGIGQAIIRFDELSEFDQMSHCVKLIMDWLTSDYLENAPEHVNHASGHHVKVRRGVSVISFLASSDPDENEKECFRNKHKKCIMMDFLLSACDSHSRRKLLTHPFTNSLTPIHFAAMTGWPCQIDILLKHGSSTEATSDYAKTPLCFAVRRNNTLIARQLMWHGADLSAVKRPHSDFDATITTVYNGYASRKFIDERQAEVKEAFHSWLSAYLAELDDRGVITISRTVSDLHESRIAETALDKMSTLPRNRTVCEKRLPIHIPRIKFDGPVAIFMIPAAYSRQDTTMESHFPHLLRTGMFYRSADFAGILQRSSEKTGSEANGESRKKFVNTLQPIPVMADSPLLIINDGEDEREIPLKPLLTHVHNGLAYAFSIPDIFETLKKETRIELAYFLALPVAEELDNNFFLIQACELASEERPPPTPEPQEDGEEAVKVEPAKGPEQAKPEPSKNQSKNAAKKAKKLLKND